MNWHCERSMSGANVTIEVRLMPNWAEFGAFQEKANGHRCAKDEEWSKWHPGYFSLCASGSFKVILMIYSSMFCGVSPQSLSWCSRTPCAHRISSLHRHWLSIKAVSYLFLFFPWPFTSAAISLRVINSKRSWWLANWIYKLPVMFFSSDCFHMLVVVDFWTVVFKAKW